jgi:predicted TIM-barrel fold metal-dependent hydrolase
VKRILDEADPGRIVMGSDWPFYHQAIALAKVLLATEGHPGARRRVLHDNAARLFRLADAV